MKFLIAYIFIGLLVCTSTLIADESSFSTIHVPTHLERLKIIDQAKSQITSKSTVSQGQYAKVVNLFEHVSDKSIVTVEDTATSVENLTDLEFLKYIAIQKVPTGIIEKNGEQYLMFAFGFVRKGGGFQGAYGKRAYAVEVLEVLPHEYTFKYNDQVLKIPFDPAKGSLILNAIP